jgi:hypothetical protein
VIAGRRGNVEEDRRIELRGTTTARGTLVATGPTLIRGGLFVGGAAGAVRPIIDDQGRWAPRGESAGGPALRRWRGLPGHRPAGGAGLRRGRRS